jgi:hypothetical protein
MELPGVRCGATLPERPAGFNDRGHAYLVYPSRVFAYVQSLPAGTGGSPRAAGNEVGVIEHALRRVRDEHAG